MFTLFKRIRSEKGELLPNLKRENFVGSQAQDLIILGTWLTVFCELFNGYCMCASLECKVIVLILDCLSTCSKS